ncbi:MAG: sigma-70 family RNA polymerase sigma factor [Planctomycetes bacterium]|nr:sigma-70 family RNA polymerase sigma factor [Planctomycetota bacterium]
MKANVNDRDLFEQQALPHRQYLFGQAYSYTHNPHEADDLVQETFARGFEKFHQFKRDTNIKAWLSRILTNLFLSDCRRRKRRLQPASIHGMEDAVVTKTAEDAQLHLEEMSAADLVIDEGFLQSIDERLKRGLENMSKRYRDAFLLNAIGNLSYSEVARKLRIPTGTVMSRLHRARTAMREAFVA